MRKYQSVSLLNTPSSKLATWVHIKMAGPKHLEPHRVQNLIKLSQACSRSELHNFCVLCPTVFKFLSIYSAEPELWFAVVIMTLMQLRSNWRQNEIGLSWEILQWFCDVGALLRWHFYDMHWISNCVLILLFASVYTYTPVETEIYA